MKASVTMGADAVTESIVKSPSNVHVPAKFREIDRLTVIVIVDNYYDAKRPDTAISKMYRATPGASVHAEHGLSYFIETKVNGKSSTFMFDYGLDPRGVMNNMALLDVDFSKADALGLSHGHFDHWGSLIEIIRQNRIKMCKEIPFYVGEESFAHRLSLRPGSSVPQDIGQLNKEEIESSGTVKIVEIKNTTEVVPGCYLTGNIDRVTEYEKISPDLLIERDGKIESDDFKGEQAVVFNLKKKGLVILSGCAHVGIVNTVKYARKITGVNKIHAIMGGFHLINAKPGIIRKTVADIKAMAPEYIMPAHCTGFEAVTAFLKEMPKQFLLNTAGTKYVLTA